MFVSKSITKKAVEAGDTIVEVLISIAVISLVLGGAYVTTNRSLLATRDAEERSIALKLAESQVEQLKSLAKTNPSLLFGASLPNPFCVDNAGAVVAATSPQCRVNSSGVPTTNQPVFGLAVTRANDNRTFTVLNQWADVSGDTQDSLRIIYRVYE